jgi:hypothetical protein
LFLVCEASAINDTWWLDHIFGRSLADKTSPEAAEIANDLPPAEALRLTTFIFHNCRNLLAPFTDPQVAEGLEYIGASGQSDWMDYIYDPAIDRQIRYDCIRSIESLYRDCFARRCRDQVLSGDLPLESVCFMWWDRFPSGGVGASSDAERPAVDHELITVMAKSLQIEHAACRESALHGLGHWASGNEARVEAIIDEWLAKHQHLPGKLVDYAKAARSGNVM